jgi:hypothetical protein
VLEKIGNCFVRTFVPSDRVSCLASSICGKSNVASVGARVDEREEASVPNRFQHFVFSHTTFSPCRHDVLWTYWPIMAILTHQNESTSCKKKKTLKFRWHLIWWLSISDWVKVDPMIHMLGNGMDAAASSCVIVESTIVGLWLPTHQQCPIICHLRITLLNIKAIHGIGIMTWRRWIRKRYFQSIKLKFTVSMQYSSIHYESSMHS